MANETIELLAQEFDVGTAFVDAILVKTNTAEFAQDAPGRDKFVAAAGDKWKYISYALSTNQRAERTLARMLSLDRPTTQGKALDVGCGYGGFLNAFGKLGFQPFGVEVDAHLAALAKLNTKDAPFESTLVVGDMFAGKATLTGFDLITVNDVIEHLPDPLGAFKRLSEALNPGGVLAIYAPNGNSVFNVAADPHHKVCGSSYMPRSLAKGYVQAYLKSPSYSLGEYVSLQTFQDLAQRHGLTFKYLPTDWGETPEQARGYLKDLVDKFAALNLENVNDSIVEREIQRHLWAYIEAYAGAAKESLSGAGYMSFKEYYISRAWTITCKKGA